MSSELPPDAPAPRLCHLVKWSDFDGYGFNLHAEKSRSGQFIGKVDEDSPAMLAGLREGDRIIEVNGVNIAQENHRQVVERIKTNPGEARLLVVDEAADRWYKERKIVVKSTQPGVLVTKTPVPRAPATSSLEPPSYENISVPDEKKSNGYENGEHSPTPQKHDGNRHSNGSAVSATVVEEEELSPKEESPQVQRAPPKEEVNSRSSTPAENTSVPDSPHSTKSSRSTNSAGGGSTHHNGHHQTTATVEEGMLNLNMSASEMRQMIANRRKKDPKKEPMDIRQKYEIIQQM